MKSLIILFVFLLSNLSIFSQNKNNINTYPPYLTKTGEAVYDYFGSSVSNAGDINGDGYDDVIVGAYRHNNNTGRVYIFYGGPIMDNEADIIITGNSSNDKFGCSVSTAGDVNNDGYSDIIIGASGCGKAYIFFGGTSNDTIPDKILTGEGYVNSFGCSVSTANDINNDGFDDVIVGDMDYYNSASNAKGRVYIYHGGSNMDVTADLHITGEGGWFGSIASNAGDVNGDVFDDIIVGASAYNNHSGKTYVYYGGSSMDTIVDITMVGESQMQSFGISLSAAGDINTDGFDDIIVSAYQYQYVGKVYIYLGGSPMDNTADITLTGENFNDLLGCSVSSAGDFNNDGYDDILVGANGYNSFYGSAYILFGGINMDNVPDITLFGEDTYGQFGSAVSSVGDINSDGYDDIIVGEPCFNNYTGKIIVYKGDSLDGGTNNFLILIEPNGGNWLFKGTNFEITWIDNIDEAVRIELFLEDTLSTILVDSTISSGSYNWLIPMDLVVSDYYKIKIISVVDSSIFGISDYYFTIYEGTNIDNIMTKVIPSNYELFDNYPNPFNPSTIIRYGVPTESRVKLIIYNVLGEKLHELIDEVQTAGYYEIKCNFNNLSTSMYIYVLEAISVLGNEKIVKAKKMIYLK
ncbi:MAG: FG-GAP repeat protein [Ignavibacteriales bacterium]|nr:FG-GAP repeat protein [Ignavibacteriales bacterium]